MELTNELLIEEYTKNKLSLTKLSQKYSISRYFISKRLMDLGISINDEFNSNLKHDKLKSLDYNTFYSLYSINNKSYKEIADLYGVTERQIKRLNVEKYHCTKTKSQSQSTRAKTMQKIYGTTTYAKSEHYKQNKSKYEQTRVDTVMRKYGVKNVFQLDSIKEKSKQSHLNRYGVSNYSQINKDPKSIEVAYDKDKLTKIITSLKPSNSKLIFDISHTAFNPFNFKLHKLFLFFKFLYSLFKSQNNMCWRSKSPFSILFHCFILI